MSESTLRPVLGDLNSIVCFKAVVVGMEQALGERTAAVGLIAAGRKRGQALVASLGLTGNGIDDPDAAASALNTAIGKDGTRLCGVDKVEVDGTAIRTYLSETVCSAGEPMGSPRTLTFTLGAVQGALEAITGRKLKGTQTASVLRGGTHDVVEFNDRI